MKTLILCLMAVVSVNLTAGIPAASKLADISKFESLIQHSDVQAEPERVLTEKEKSIKLIIDSAKQPQEQRQPGAKATWVDVSPLPIQCGGTLFGELQTKDGSGHWKFFYQPDLDLFEVTNLVTHEQFLSDMGGNISYAAKSETFSKQLVRKADGSLEIKEEGYRAFINGEGQAGWQKKYDLVLEEMAKALN